MTKKVAIVAVAQTMHGCKGTSYGDQFSRGYNDRES